MYKRIPWGKNDLSRDDGHRNVKGSDQRWGQPKPTMWEDTNGEMCILKRKKMSDLNIFNKFH